MFAPIQSTYGLGSYGNGEPKNADPCFGAESVFTLRSGLSAPRIANSIPVAYFSCIGAHGPRRKDRPQSANGACG